MSECEGKWTILDLYRIHSSGRFFLVVVSKTSSFTDNEVAFATGAAHYLSPSHPKPAFRGESFSLFFFHFIAVLLTACILEDPHTPHSPFFFYLACTLTVCFFMYKLLV